MPCSSKSIFIFFSLFFAWPYSTCNIRSILFGMHVWHLAFALYFLCLTFYFYSTFSCFSFLKWLIRFVIACVVFVNCCFHFCVHYIKRQFLVYIHINTIEMTSITNKRKNFELDKCEYVIRNSYREMNVLSNIQYHTKVDILRWKKNAFWSFCMLIV